MSWFVFHCQRRQSVTARGSLLVLEARFGSCQNPWQARGENICVAERGLQSGSLFAPFFSMTRASSTCSEDEKTSVAASNLVFSSRRRLASLLWVVVAAFTIVCGQVPDWMWFSNVHQVCFHYAVGTTSQFAGHNREGRSLGRAGCVMTKRLVVQIPPSNLLLCPWA